VRLCSNFGIPNDTAVIIILIQANQGIGTMPDYAVRHHAERLEEWPCLIQIEDEGAAMYFNIVHGAKIRRRFTTEETGKPCEDFLLVAREYRAFGGTEEREITLFELA
jgi:hypothetical protein